MRRGNYGTMLAMAAGLAVTPAALAQPTATDLGTLNLPTTIDQVVSLTPGAVVWYTFTIPSGVDRSLSQWLDIAGLSSTGTATDTMMGLYDSLGNRVAFDDDDSTGLLPALSFGLDAPTRPLAGGVAFNGRDGATLAPGQYYLAYTGFGGTIWGLTGWSVTSTHTRTGDNTWRLTLDSLNALRVGTPVVTGCAIEAAGGTLTVAATVTPRTTPPSTGITVSVDASAVGGGTLAMLDNGVAPDLVAGDNIYSASVTVPSSVFAGTYSIGVTATDAEGSTSSNTGNVIVAAPPAVGSVPATAFVPSGAPGSPLTSITGTMDPAVPQMWQINICDPLTFSATTVGGATWDTTLFVFDATGRGVVMNDDAVGLQSTIDSTIVAALPPGQYFLALARYNRKPSAGSPCDAQEPNRIWSDSPFAGQRIPNGARAADPIQSWQGAAVATAGDFTITLTGACVPGSAGPTCDTLDYNQDGDFPTPLDLEDFIAANAGNICSTCSTDLDFNNDGDFPSPLDVEAFISVNSGGPCL